MSCHPQMPLQILQGAANLLISVSFLLKSLPELQYMTNLATRGLSPAFLSIMPHRHPPIHWQYPLAVLLPFSSQPPCLFPSYVTLIPKVSVISSFPYPSQNLLSYKLPIKVILKNIKKLYIDAFTLTKNIYTSAQMIWVITAPHCCNLFCLFLFVEWCLNVRL